MINDVRPPVQSDSRALHRQGLSMSAIAAALFWLEWLMKTRATATPSAFQF